MVAGFMHRFTENRTTYNIFIMHFSCNVIFEKLKVSTNIFFTDINDEPNSFSTKWQTKNIKMYK